MEIKNLYKKIISFDVRWHIAVKMFERMVYVFPIIIEEKKYDSKNSRQDSG